MLLYIAMSVKVKQTKFVAHSKKLKNRTYKTERRRYNIVRQAQVVALKKQSLSSRQIEKKIDIDQRAVSRIHRRVINRSLDFEIALDDLKRYPIHRRGVKFRG